MVVWVVVITVGVAVFLSLQNDSTSGTVSGSSEEMIYSDSYLQGREMYYSDEFYEDYYKN